MKYEVVRAMSIDDAHFKLIRRLFQVGRVYVVERGSFEGHKRLEFDFVGVQLTHPGTRPLAPILPPGVPPVTDDKSIEEYCAKYLLSPNVADNEIYTYGYYISRQIDKVIKMFREQGFGTNQATITVGGIESIHQEDPPCLRLIDFRVKDGRLHMILYFRSWDLWAGLPENLGGLQLLKEYVASEVGVDDGEIIAHSKGLHLYDYQWPVAFARLNCVLPEDSVLSREEIELGENWMENKDRSGNV